MIPASVLQSLPAQQAANITSRAFFPQLIDTAFHHGLVEVLVFRLSCVLLELPLPGFGVVNTSTAKILSPSKPNLLNCALYGPPPLQRRNLERGYNIRTTLRKLLSPIKTAHHPDLIHAVIIFELDIL